MHALVLSDNEFYRDCSSMSLTLSSKRKPVVVEWLSLLDLIKFHCSEDVF